MKRFQRYLLPALLALVPLAASAQITILPSCTASGNCGISDILAVFVNVAEYLLGISGAVALGFFVYGGFVFVLSRGNKGEVDKAFGILRSAVTGIAIIFLSGVLIRFTTQALTGGQSAIPTVGETCKHDDGIKPTLGKSDPNGDGLWVSIPAGFKDGAVIPEGLICVKKESGRDLAKNKACENLNGILKDRGRFETYSCQDVSTTKSTDCVRGLCIGPGMGANIACCKD